MTDRDTQLAGLRESIGGIDPVLDQAANYGKGVRAIQKIVHEQGQVMSKTLENNHLLYHTNKKLVAQNRELVAENESLRRRFEIISERNSQLERTLANGGGDTFLALYTECRKTLEAYLHDAMTPEELRRKLVEMEAQKKELQALPELVTEAELVAMEVIEPPRQ
jgi:hypothetical protein